MKTKKALAVLLTLVLTLGLLPVFVAAEEQNITVIVSFEGYNLGHGFYVEPTEVTIPVGSTAMDATIGLLEELNLTFEFNDWGVLDRIFDMHPGETNVPEYITIPLAESAGDGSVGSFDYSTSSGWMFTLNHFLTPVGADSALLVSGDVIRWQFTVEGWGADLGLGFDRGGFAQLYEHADKTELIRGLFVEGAIAVDAALEVIINPTATAEEVAEAFAALELDFEDVDGEELAALIADGNTRVRETYVPADAEWDPPAWGLFAQALITATLVYENEVATPMAVEGAVLRLQMALADLIPVPVEAEEEWVNPFVDVSEDDWFYDYVRFVHSNGLMTGTAANTFSPDGMFTYGMAVTVMWRLAGAPEVAADTDTWYAVPLAWAIAEGIVAADVLVNSVMTVAGFAAMLDGEVASGLDRSAVITRAVAAYMLAQ